MTPRIWRFIQSPPASGAWNMAFDEILVRSVQNGEPPVFRLYSWLPATLSLGRFQNAQMDLDPAGLEQMKMPVVRRMTGGGALFHGPDFTYSLVCTQEDLGDLTVKESFRLLCNFLVSTWKAQGWEAGFARELSPRTQDLGVKTPVCFAGREEYDILVKDASGVFRKLGGNAQKRLRNVIFQHGSVPIAQDWERVSHCLSPHARPNWETTSYPVDLGALGWVGERNLLENQLKGCFFQSLNRNFVPWEPQGSFLNDVTTLEKSKYLTELWNYQGIEP